MTISPQTYAPYNVAFGLVTPFDATFTIDSPVGQVTGTKHLVNEATGGEGLCTDDAHSASADVTYSAHITTPDGRGFDDNGSASASVTESFFNGTSTGNDLQESFVSSLGVPAPVTPTAADACKSDGFRRVSDSQGFAFRNQGQCVSFVRSHRGGNG